MKGVILAAGRATRLYPITKTVSKMILPVYNRPVIHFALKTLITAGVKETLIICRESHKKQIASVVENVDEYKSIQIKLKVKNHDLGMPYSVLQARSWAKEDNIMVLPGDNIYLQNYRSLVKRFKKGAAVHLTKVKDPERSGTIVLKDKKIVDLVEKPKNPQTNYALTAPYIFDSTVYNRVSKLKPSARGELEVTELLKMYLEDRELIFPKTTGYWQDIGTFEALLEAGNYLKRVSSGR